MWAWTNRHRLAGWAQFAVRVARKGAKHPDSTAEARLRASLIKNASTRSERHLNVTVDDGVATLTGAVSDAAQRDARRIARSTRGVTAVNTSFR